MIYTWCTSNNSWSHLSIGLGGDCWLNRSTDGLSGSKINQWACNSGIQSKVIHTAGWVVAVGVPCQPSVPRPLQYHWPWPGGLPEHRHSLKQHRLLEIQLQSDVGASSRAYGGYPGGSSVSVVDAGRGMNGGAAGIGAAGGVGNTEDVSVRALGVCLNSSAGGQVAERRETAYTIATLCTAECGCLRDED